MHKILQCPGFHTTKTTLLLGVFLNLLAACQTTSEVYTQSADGKSVLVVKSQDSASSLSRFADPRPVSEREASANEEIASKEEINAARSAQPHIDLARIYLMRNEIKKAREHCNLALRLELQNTDAIKLLAEVEVASGNFKKAELILSRFLSRGFEKDATVASLWVQIHTHNKDWPSVYSTTVRVTELDPLRIDAWMNRAIYELHMGQNERARASIAQATQRTPNNADAHTLLGIAYLRLGDSVNAEFSLTRAAEIDPQNGLAQYYLAASQEKLIKLEEALANVETALKSNGQTLIEPLRLDAELMKGRIEQNLAAAEAQKQNEK